MTFQDDYSVRHALDGMNAQRVLWASDFPHSDGTYPDSEKVIGELAASMSDQQSRWIFRDNAAELFGLTV